MRLPCGQIYRAMPDGDGSVQAAEDAEAEQRPHLLLPLPDPAGAQVHPLGQRPAPGPQAQQPATQHHLRSQGQLSVLCDKSVSIDLMH